MRIEWDAPIVMDDGVTLRADVSCPADEDHHPVILSYGPYAKGLSFQVAYAPQWEKMISEHPDGSASLPGPSTTRIGEQARSSTRILRTDRMKSSAMT